MQSWDTLVDFPDEAIDKMRQIISTKRDSPELKSFFVNTILREDIFDILDACCTVIYFPLEGEDNDGFQVSRTVDYGGEHVQMFVFLNTAKPLEKQIFAAGHELGHLWNVADNIWNTQLENQFPRKENEEAAMNRFSAELLMPEKTFYQSASSLLKSYQTADGKIKIIDGIRVIASLMNEFCVPDHAIVRRLYETKCLSKESCIKLRFTGPNEAYSETYEETFHKILKACIDEGGYTRLNKPTLKRGIKDFPLVLNAIEQKGVFSQKKIENLRRQLNIPAIDRQEGELADKNL